MWTKFNSFMKTTVFGGFLIVLPLIIMVFVLQWFYDFVLNAIAPVTNVLIDTARISHIVASIIAIAIILVIFFLVGLAVQTNLGRYIFQTIEERGLKKVKLYKIIKETVIQLFGGEKLIFRSVALVKLFESDTLLTGFITDETVPGITTVFVPSGPAPTGGFVYHVPSRNVYKLDYPPEQAMRTIFSLGAGSRELFQSLNKKSPELYEQLIKKMSEGN